MDKEIAAHYNAGILQEIARRYGIHPRQLKLLRQQIDLIFTCSNRGEDSVFKVAHSSKQTSDKIFSEVHWLDHLRKNNVNIAFPLQSENGKLMEVIPAGDTYFTVVKYSKAEGRQVTFRDWNDSFFEELGRLTGRLHNATKSYVPETGIVLRDDCVVTDAERVRKNIVAGSELINAMDKLLQRVNAIPRDKNSYGLLHNDINDGNMFLNKGKICLFDSADCAYSWFVTDIAVILLYAIINFDNNLPNQRLTMLVRNFMTHFWKGYLEYNQLSQNEVALIPDIMHLKSIFAFDHIQKVYARIAQLNHVQEKYKGQLQSFWVESFSFLNINLIGY